MHTFLDPFSFLVVSLSGWMNQHQQHVIHYLIEETRVLRQQIGNRRMRFSDAATTLQAHLSGNARTAGAEYEGESCFSGARSNYSRQARAPLLSGTRRLHDSWRLVRASDNGEGDAWMRPGNPVRCTRQHRWRRSTGILRV